PVRNVDTQSEPRSTGNWTVNTCGSRVAPIPTILLDYYDASNRLFLRPFPQQAPAGMSMKDFWTRYRKDMLSKAGVCIFIAGNKLDASTGNVVDADGIMEEFDIASSLGKYPIPIGATGHAARKVWERVNGALDSHFP